MPVEEIVDGFFHFVGRVICRAVFELIFEFLLYYVGRMVLFMVTLGQYQPSGDDESKGFVSIVGLFSIIVAVVVFVTVKNM